jgi:hypothetical protein
LAAKSISATAPPRGTALHPGIVSLGQLKVLDDSLSQHGYPHGTRTVVLAEIGISRDLGAADRSDNHPETSDPIRPGMGHGNRGISETTPVPTDGIPPPGVEGSEARVAPKSRAVRPAPRVHRVAPRETLWSIAADRLGSARRWRELADLNYGIRQSDGGSLGRDHWVRSGWTLQLPTDGVAPGVHPLRIWWPPVSRSSS